MARGSIDILLRKNSKLESFLRRTLSEDTYERIRAYESCIVVSEKENKAFKYVVLGDEWIYLTENPPKAVQESVCLRDLISVELVSLEEYTTTSEWIKVNSVQIQLAS